MMSEHTQGPWKAVNRPNIAHPYAIEQDKPHGMVVAELITVSMDDRPEDDANARLIAAAPEMLAVLEDVLMVSDHSMKTAGKIREVLYKARGD